jgi:hypothetical protein
MSIGDDSSRAQGEATSMLGFISTIDIAETEDWLA